MFKKRNTMTFVIIALAVFIFACGSSDLFTNDQSTESTGGISPSELNESSRNAQIPGSIGIDEQSNEITSPSDSKPLIPLPSTTEQCVNVLYPLRLGHEWIYQVENPYGTSQISLQVSDVNGDHAIITLTDLDTGQSSEVTVNCQDGAILNFPDIMLAALLTAGNTELNIVYVDGVFAPGYDTLNENNWNYQWTGTYHASGKFDVVLNGKQIAGNLQESPLTITWQIPEIGEELISPVQVPAGIFPYAIKLNRVLSFDFTAELEGDSQVDQLSAVLNLYAVMWFEPNLGLLKQEIVQADMEVFGVSFPINIESTINLIKYQTGWLYTLLHY